MTRYFCFIRRWQTRLHRADPPIPTKSRKARPYPIRIIVFHSLDRAVSAQLRCACKLCLDTIRREQQKRHCTAGQEFNIFFISHASTNRCPPFQSSASAGERSHRISTSVSVILRGRARVGPIPPSAPPRTSNPRLAPGIGYHS